MSGRARGPGPAGDDRMRPVSDALERLSAELGLDLRASTAGVLDSWDAVAGEEVVGNATPVRFAEGVLTVEVVDPAWATHLRFLAPRLVEDLNRAVEGAPVRELRIVVARR